jgi:hypothetical protein
VIYTTLGGVQGVPLACLRDFVILAGVLYSARLPGAGARAAEAEAP